MRVKILVLGLVSLCLLFTVGIQAQEKYTLTELEGVMDSAVFKATGRRIITMLEKENGVVNFYVDTHVKDFTSSASYTDYQTINAVVVSAAITMKQVSWKADRVWFLRAGKKIAWISVDRCKTILDRKSKSPSYLFEGINLVDIEQTEIATLKNLKAQKQRADERAKRDAFSDIGGGFAVRRITAKSFVGMTKILGEIKNNSGQSYTLVNIIVALYDSEDNLLDNAVANISNFTTGSVKSFSAYASVSLNRIARYRVQFENAI